ncbi:MAG: hypothetical protein H0T90_04480 [Gemmatimonadales bacterium]|nr:hypothetical protein [Gemmatimonadales bacterium]
MTARISRLIPILAAAVLGCDNNATGPAGSAGLLGPDPAGVCLDESGNPLPLAPDSDRVDLAQPAFSNPTNVTNPLFPASTQFRVLQLGSSDGLPLRAEVTLLPETKTVELDGKAVEVLVSQYIAFLDGDILEAALDFYAQADDGAAWYFGEDVFNYEDGLVADNDGTWLAGRDGPPGMIMPADPQVGDVWRPENICGLVFEQVTARSAGLTVDGPRGPVAGALLVEELHMDGLFEEKTYAPGYGEFAAGSGSDGETVAIAIPVDALPGLPPKELEIISGGAADIFDAAQAEEWDAVLASVTEMADAWTTFKEGDAPPLLEAQMDSALARLAGAVEGRESAEVRQAAIYAAQAGLDLQLRYRTAAETDLDLLDLWARQLVVDAAAGDRGGVLGAAAVLKWIRDRVARDVSIAELSNIDASLGRLRAAVTAADFGGVIGAAGNFRSTVARTPRTGRRR